MITLTQTQFTEVIDNKGFKFEEGTQTDSMMMDGVLVHFDLDVVSFTKDDKIWFSFTSIDGNNDGGFWKFEGRQNVWTKGRTDKTWRVEKRAEQLLGL